MLERLLLDRGTIVRGEVETLTETVREALGAFVSAKFRALLRQAGKLLGQSEDAEEAVQETALRAARSVGSLRDAASLRPWILRTLENQCRSVLRRRLREGGLRLPLIDDLDEESDGRGHDVAGEGSAVRLSLLVAPDRSRSEEVVRVVRREVARLPEELRIPVVRVDLLEEPIGEVARSLGMPRTTLAKRLDRAHEALHPRLAPLARGDE
ncbi:MAG TPA: sigma-70 family RNA polymerase sigma factor [Planctomycetota bacterium]|nr:sigma-70 family RNA polymerase sigma factor [Planctomycetota bacterium]